MGAKKKASAKKVVPVKVQDPGSGIKVENRASDTGIKTSTPLRSIDRKKGPGPASKKSGVKVPVKVENLAPDSGLKPATPQPSRKIDIKAEDLDAMIQTSTPLRSNKKIVTKTPDTDAEIGTRKPAERTRRSGSRGLPFEAPLTSGNKRRKSGEAKMAVTVDHEGDALVEIKADDKKLVGKSPAKSSKPTKKGKAKKGSKRAVKALVAEVGADVAVVRSGKGNPKKAEKRSSPMPALDSAGIVAAAVESLADAKGLTSYVSLQRYIGSQHPEWRQMTFKGGLKRALAKGRIQKIKNSFKVAQKKAGAQKVSNKSKTSRKIEGPLVDLLPHVFTWIVEPKESTFKAIQNYISTHFAHLKPDGNNLKEAIKNGIVKGQLTRVSGSVVNGTFRLVDGAPKTGTQFEDAIEDAIIASTEPKECSFKHLRDYLTEYHTEYNVGDNPKVLLRALEEGQESGAIKRISGNKGMSGNFRLGSPYCPSPKDLWREAYTESDYQPNEMPEEQEEASASEEEKADEERPAPSFALQKSIDKELSDDEDDEPVPVKKGRSAPAKRSSLVKTPISKKKKPMPKKASDRKPTSKRSRR